MQGVPHTELVEMVKSADIVVDQLLLGSYGVFACEAMAAGRVTVGHIADPSGTCCRRSCRSRRRRRTTCPR